MKRTTFTLILFLSIHLLYASNSTADETKLSVATSKTSTINVTAGQLSSILSATELNTITDLALIGTIDARDFKTMNYKMPQLANLDLSGVSILAYSGTEGTIENSYSSYPINTIPFYAFYRPGVVNKTLTSVIIPLTVTAIGPSAFSYCKSLATITIPSSIISIGNGAFSYCQSLTSITIPSTVISIGSSAFNMGCLINVDPGNPNYSSQDGVLYDKLKTILIKCPTTKTGSFNIPSTVTSIGSNAFSDCTNLTSITMPSTVITIGDMAFYNCYRLTSFTMSTSVTSIGVGVFQVCNGLTSINLPATVTSIGDYAFNQFNSINVDSGNQNYSSQDGVLYDKLKTILIHCPVSKTGSFSIPSSVKTIGRAAFSSCSGLTSVIIPSSITDIGIDAFGSCSNLTSINIPSSVTSIGYHAFALCSGLTSISVNNKPIDLSAGSEVFLQVTKTACALNVPYGMKSLYMNASQWSDFQNIVEKPGFLLPTNTAKLTAINGSNAIISVAANVVWNASSDQSWLSVSPTNGINNGVITMAAQGNPNNTPRTAIITVSAVGVESQTITVTQLAPISVTAGGLSSILSATELSNITVLSLTGTIDARDFKTIRDKMPLLTNLDLSGVSIVAYTGTEGTATAISTSTIYPANTIPEFAFYNYSINSGMKTLKTVNIPGSVTSIGFQAFVYCSGLSNIDIPNSVISIGSTAFQGCSGLSTIMIPGSVSFIGSDAFAGCVNLATFNVDINNLNYSSINGVLFNKDKSILVTYPTGNSATNYSIPGTVKTINDKAFNQCYALTSITIPNSVVTIGNEAFLNCRFSSVDIPNSVITIGNNAFTNCSLLTSIAIPGSVTTIGYSAFELCAKLGSINVEPSNSNYASVGGVLFNKDVTTLIAYPMGITSTSYSIPATVKTLGSSAFIYCSRLASISIPASVTSIGSATFQNCTGLTSIELPIHISYIDTYAFSGCINLRTVTIPSSVTTLLTGAFYNCTSLSTIHAKSAIPINLSAINDVFTNVPVTTCTLYIPTNFKSLYQAADKWKAFTNMVEELPECVLSTNKVTLSGNGETNTVDMITTTVAWTVKSDKDWVTVTPSSGVDDATLTISSGTNPTIQTRTATVTIYYGEFVLQSITVTQNPGPPTLSVSSNGITINKRVSTVAITSNSAWTVASDHSWLVLNASSGEGNATLTLTADANLTTTPRTAMVTVAVSSSLSKTITVIQEAATLTLSSNSLAIKAGYGSTVSGTVTSNVAWTASADQSWLLLNTYSGDGNATLTLTSEANLSPTPRMATVTVFVAPGLSKTITVTQEAATLSVSGNSLAIKAGNGSTVTCTVTSNVTWSVKSDQSWLAVNTSSGDGNATLTFTAYANLATISRMATVTIVVSPGLSKTITVTQEAATLSVSGNSLAIKAGNGSTATCTVTSNVTWSVTSDQSWLAINTSSGDGNATLTFTAYANLSPTLRMAIVTIVVSPGLSKTIAVTQEAATLTVSNNTLAIKAGNGSTVSGTVTSNVAWTVSADQSWLSLNIASGDGNATLTFTANANLSPTTRTATVTIVVSPGLSKTITVTQEAATLSLSSNSLTIKGGNGSTATCTVTSNVTWSVTSDQSWLELNTSSGDGNATLTFTAGTNLSTSPRSAMVSVTVSSSLSKTITVTQQPYIIASIVKKWNNVLICDNSQNLFATYQWYKNDNIIASATKQYYRESESLPTGNYYVKVTTTDGSDGISNTLIVNTASKAIKLYPNPVINGQSSSLSIDVLPSELEGARLTITSLSGQVIQQSNILSTNTSIRGLSKGSYVIHVTFADGSSYNEKLVIY